jgi:hypothetical protein
MALNWSSDSFPENLQLTLKRRNANFVQRRGCRNKILPWLSSNENF